MVLGLKLQVLIAKMEREIEIMKENLKLYFDWK